MIKLLFTRSDGLVSKFIRRFTWHWTSHVAIDIDGTVWECNHNDGCITLPRHRWDALHDHDTEEIEIDGNQAAIIKRLNSRLGVGYDWGGLLGFLINANTGKRDRLVCSEYIGWAINEDKMFFAHSKYYRLSPRHLYIAAWAHNKALDLTMDQANTNARF